MAGWLEDWKTGRLEDWMVGRLGGWKTGWLDGFVLRLSPKDWMVEAGNRGKEALTSYSILPTSIVFAKVATQANFNISSLP